MAVLTSSKALWGALAACCALVLVLGLGVWRFTAPAEEPDQVEAAAQAIGQLRASMEEIGYTVAVSRGDAKAYMKADGEAKG